MRRYSFIFITMAVVMAMAFNTAQAKKTVASNNMPAVTMANDDDSNKSALDKYRERAAKGDAEAMLLLGKAYYHGLEGLDVDYKKAAKWFLDAAEVKDEAAAKWSAEAKGWLGLLYYSGKGVDPDKDRAMKLFLIATKGGFSELVTTFEDMAKEGDIFACKFMSECYNKGYGVKRNTDTAAKYTRRAADAGDKESYMSTALYLYNNDNKGESFKYFEKAALEGDIKACYFYGMMLYDGNEMVEQDKVKGMKYLQMAADEGHVAANFKLGELYLYGNGVTRDKEKGAKMIKVAAENGNNKAMWILGNCYRLGEGIKQDYALAAHWMSLVASGSRWSDYDKLISELKERNDPFYIYLKGLQEYYINGNYDNAMNQFKALEKAKIAEGKTMQGVVLTNKNYKKKDLKKAAKIFEKASTESPLACYYLSFMKENGDAGKQDPKAALDLLTKAAEGGCAQAQCRLGDKYIKGSGVGMDIEKAAKYYLLAEAQHALTPESAKQLAKLYENELSGMPVVEDLAKHVENLKKTKENNSLVKMLANTKF